MRRWRMVLAGAALTAATLATSGPAYAMNANSLCRIVTNQARRALHESGENMNREFNQERNEICGSLDK